MQWNKYSSIITIIVQERIFRQHRGKTETILNRIEQEQHESVEKCTAEKLLLIY